MAQLVAKRYAKALFDLAIENDELDACLEQAIFISNMMEENPDFSGVINHPEIGSQAKMKLMETIFEGKVSNTILGLFRIIFIKGRESSIISILDEFSSMVKEHKGITVAYISSALALTQEQISSIQNTLTKNLNKQVEVETEVDPSLIGGLCIKVDGHIYDSTVSKQLRDMTNNLLGLQLAQ